MHLKMWNVLFVLFGVLLLMWLDVVGSTYGWSKHIILWVSLFLMSS